MGKDTKVKRFAEVAPAVPLPGTGKQTYTYRIPAAGNKDLGLYSSVTVPLGKRLVKGFVVDVHNRSVPFKTKQLAVAGDAQLTAHQVTFARWIAQTMHGGLGYTLRLFLPSRHVDHQPAVPKSIPQEKKTPLQLTVIDQESRRRALVNELVSLAASKQQALILVPELWMVEQVRASLPDTLVVQEFHSKLTPKQASLAWGDVRSGTADVVIGTQKALFLPYHQLGVVVIEEEAYHSHKLWDAYPRLDGRYGARKLAEIHNAPIIYSSSFHSPTLTWGIRNHELVPLRDKPLKLRSTIIAATFADRQHKWTVPREAVETMHTWLEAGERVLFLQHKHDSAVRHTLHQRFDRYMQKIDARTPRIDEDARLLVATSAVFTLLAGQKVDRTLLLFPEKSLAYPDYRAEEELALLVARLQQLLPARRNVTIVTKAPQLLEDRFLPHLEPDFTKLLEERRRLQLPPVTDLVRLTIAAKTPAEAHKRASIIREQLQESLPDGTMLRGPFRSSTTGKKSEAHLLLRGPASVITPLYEQLAVTNADLAPEHIL